MTATYGVSGMMEWVALIPAGKTVLRVRFSGGGSSGFSVPMATFTTRNPAIMEIIEKSRFFQTGRIRLVSKTKDQPENESQGKPARWLYPKNPR